MFLSRVEINPRLRACMLALASPHRLHAIIASSFPKMVISNTPGRHLWRIDKLNHSLFVLVVSPIKPDFTHLIEQIGWPASEQSWESVSYDKFLFNLHPDQLWQFRLRSNPTYGKKDTEKIGTRGKVTPCLSIEEQKTWLEKKMVKHGAALNHFELTSREVSHFSRNGQTITLNTATFEGILTITDPDSLRKAMVDGVGRAKAYGCGLLTLTKVQS